MSFVHHCIIKIDTYLWEDVFSEVLFLLGKKLGR